MKQLWNADLDNGCYRNPVLYTDYSDPDVIRVGDDYYMISSSFTYVPGVPLLHSKDLVHWELINYVVKKLPFDRYDQPAHGAGTWAPALGYHNGIYYAFIPMPDEGIFVSETKDPYGQWSELRCIKEAKGWIDPCPFWDEDGKAYMIFAYAKSRCGIKHRLSICEMDEKATELLTEPVLVYDGIQGNPTIEGPKLYKRNGWYYIFAPAGGVSTGWQTVLRSRNIYGPYEYKIVMHQGNSEVNGPHQGGYVETQNGDFYFIHFQDAGPYGRIIHMQPMCWNGDWPFIGEESNGDGIGEPVAMWQYPVKLSGENYTIPSSDDFKSEELGLQWQWQANPDSTWYSLSGESKGLVLNCMNNKVRDENLLWYAPNACTQMLQAPEFQTETCITLQSEEHGDFAGLGIIGHLYTYCGLELCDGKLMVRLREGRVLDRDGIGKAVEWVTHSIDMPAGINKIWLRINVKAGGIYSYSYSVNETDYNRIGEEYQAVKASWTGAKLALYSCNTANKVSKGYGIYESIKFTN